MKFVLFLSIIQAYVVVLNYRMNVVFYKQAYLLFQAIVVDGSGHLLGRLAAVVAKALLNGDKVVVLKCEEINISGSFFRSVLLFLLFEQFSDVLAPVD